MLLTEETGCEVCRNSELSSQIFCKSKSFLKYKVLFLKICIFIYKQSESKILKFHLHQYQKAENA